MNISMQEGHTDDMVDLCRAAWPIGASAPAPPLPMTKKRLMSVHCEASVLVHYP